jgi:hypothetical protein
MLNAQLQYPVFTHDYRAQPTHSAPIAKRDIRRLFRLSDSRIARREARGR